MHRITKRWRLLLASFVAASLTFAPRPATAQAPADQTGDTAVGKSHFDTAVALFREGDYRAALVEFRRAYEISHNYRALFNVAQTEFEVQDYAGALRSFKKYLAEGGAEIEAERRATVEADIKQLAGRVATLTVVSNTPSADVLVDDILIGRTPLSEPVLVSAGSRKITIQKGDLAPVSRVVEVAGGDTSTITLNLTEPRPASSVAAAVTAPALALVPPKSSPPSPGFWLSLSATTLLAAGGGVAGGFALDSYNDTKAKLARRGVAAADIESAHSRTATLAVAADVLGGAAIVMGAVAIVIGVVGGKSDAGSPKPSASVRVGPQGVALTGQF